MITKIKKDGKDFQPVILEITIENEQDLCELWHRFNVGRGVLLGTSYYTSTKSLKHMIKGTEDHGTWNIVNDLVRKHNLKTNN